jgi:hypothetical protein
MTMQRHAFDPVSAALGVIAITLGLLVTSGSIERVDRDGGWWLAFGMLVIGLGLVPWSRRRGATATQSTSVEPSVEPFSGTFTESVAAPDRSVAAPDRSPAAGAASPDDPPPDSP